MSQFSLEPTWFISPEIHAPFPSLNYLAPGFGSNITSSRNPSLTAQSDSSCLFMIFSFQLLIFTLRCTLFTVVIWVTCIPPQNCQPHGNKDYARFSHFCVLSAYHRVPASEHILRICWTEICSLEECWSEWLRVLFHSRSSIPAAGWKCNLVSRVC